MRTNSVNHPRYENSCSDPAAIAIQGHFSDVWGNDRLSEGSNLIMYYLILTSYILNDCARTDEFNNQAIAFLQALLWVIAVILPGCTGQQAEYEQWFASIVQIFFT